MQSPRNRSPHNPYLVNVEQPSSPRLHHLAGHQLAFAMHHHDPHSHEQESEYKRQYQWNAPQSNLLLNIRVNQGSQHPAQQARQYVEFVPPRRETAGQSPASAEARVSPRHASNEQPLSTPQPFGSWDAPRGLPPRNKESLAQSSSAEPTPVRIRVSQTPVSPVIERAAPQVMAPGSPTIDQQTQTAGIEFERHVPQSFGRTAEYSQSFGRTAEYEQSSGSPGQRHTWHAGKLELPVDYFQSTLRANEESRTPPAPSKDTGRGKPETRNLSNRATSAKSIKQKALDDLLPQTPKGARQGNSSRSQTPKTWDKDPMRGNLGELLESSAEAEYKRKPWRLRARRWPGVDGVEAMLHELAASGSTHGVRLEAATALWGDNEEFWDEDAAKRAGELDNMLNRTADSTSQGLDAVRSLRKLDREAFDLCYVLGVPGADVVPESDTRKRKTGRKVARV